MIEYHSLAAEHFREKVRAVVDAYIEYSRIVQNAQDHPYVLGPIAIDESRLDKFKNAIHEGYSDLNGFELEFAQAIDKTEGFVPKSSSGWIRDRSLGFWEDAPVQA